MRTQTVGGVRPAGVEPGREQIKHRYLEALTLIERLHRRLLDVIKDDFERAGAPEVNPVQALLLFNIGDSELTAGELKTRGHYQGSNVSYNLKKLVEAGYVNHERSNSDKRSVRVRLTPRGQATLRVVDRARADQFLSAVRPLPTAERALVAMGVAALATHAISRRGRLIRGRD